MLAALLVSCGGSSGVGIDGGESLDGGAVDAAADGGALYASTCYLETCAIPKPIDPCITAEDCGDYAPVRTPRSDPRYASGWLAVAACEDRKALCDEKVQHQRAQCDRDQCNEPLYAAALDCAAPCFAEVDRCASRCSARTATTGEDAVNCTTSHCQPQETACFRACGLP